ncbi:MAG: hypothetical protein ACOZIN_03910 [Myxococcota bacterium]
MSRWHGLVVVLLLPLGCPLLNDDGGGGGSNSVVFSKGFVFVRKDDRNVYVADEADLSTVGRLTTAGGAHHPSLSQDGRQVVFVQTNGGESAIQTVAVNGGALPSTVFSSTATQKNLRTPVFSPDGRKIAFAYDEGASSSIGWVNADGTGFERLAGGSALSYASPSFYSDGTRLLAIAGSSSATYTQLENIDLATGTATNVTSNLGPAALQVANRVVVSPDGSKAAFDARTSVGGVRIFVIDLTSKEVGQLTEYPADPNVVDGFPTWVGISQVGFSSDSGGNDQVYALPANITKSSGGLKLPSAIEPWYGPN